MADDYVEIKDYSKKESAEPVEKKAPKKEKRERPKAEKTVASIPKKRAKKKTDYTWLWIVLILVAIAVVLIVVFSQPSAKETAGQVEEAGPDEVAARVNNEDIMVSEVNELYSSIPEQYRALYTPELILEQLIDEKLLLQEALAQEITVSEEEMDATLNILKLQIPLGQTLEDVLEERNLTMDSLLSYITEDILKRKLINKTVLSGITVTEEEMMDYFDKTRTGNISFSEVKDRIEQTLLLEKQTTAMEDYFEELRSKANILIFLGEVTTATLPEAEELEELQPTLEPEVIEPVLPETAACVEEYGLATTDIIFYYATADPYSVTMLGIVQKLESEGTRFYWAEYFDEERAEVANKCFVLEEFVPQFICPKTGEVKIGTLRESSLRAFVAGCV